MYFTNKRMRTYLLHFQIFQDSTVFFWALFPINARAHLKHKMNSGSFSEQARSKWPQHRCTNSKFIGPMGWLALTWEACDGRAGAVEASGRHWRLSPFYQSYHRLETHKESCTKTDHFQRKKMSQIFCAAVYLSCCRPFCDWSKCRTVKWRKVVAEEIYRNELRPTDLPLQ